VTGLGDLAVAGVRSAAKARQDADAFAEVQRFCLFLGHGRSGHSLVGSLLNAHRHVVVAHELDALRYVRLGFRRNQLYWLLLERDREFEEGGREWTGYSYAVPNQWQGRFEELRVIGDKKGGITSQRLKERPELLGKLRRTVGVPLRIILVVRNPYDNVATLSKRLKFTVDQALEQYVAACRTIADVRGQLAEDEHAELRHEDLIAAPQASLARLCAFLDVDAPADYLDDCASILFDAPHRSRDDEAWTGSQRSRLDAAIERFPFLHGYAFDA
jgi:hypothetical protein